MLLACLSELWSKLPCISYEYRKVISFVFSKHPYTVSEMVPYVGDGIDDLTDSLLLVFPGASDKTPFVFFFGLSPKRHVYPSSFPLHWFRSLSILPLLNIMYCIHSQQR